MPETSDPPPQQHEHVASRKAATSAGESFFAEHLELDRLVDFILLLVDKRSEDDRRGMLAQAKALRRYANAVEDVNNHSPSPEERFSESIRGYRAEAADLEALAAELHPVWREYINLQRTLHHMALARAVDNFAVYFRDLLGLVYTARPEAMKSSATTEDYEFILEHKTMEDLVAAMVTKRMETLEHEGMREFVKYFATIGFDLFPDKDARQRVTLLVEQRNLIAHNRSIINQRYVRAVAEPATLIGSILDTNLNHLRNSAAFLASCVEDIDGRAGKKWSIEKSAAATG